MNGLIKNGLKALASGNNRVGESSCYRDVFGFKYRGRKFVIKLDSWSYDEGSCWSEWANWQFHSSDENFRKWFTPVLAAGQFGAPEREPEEGECCWVIMPWRQVISKVIRNEVDEAQTRYLEQKIWPQFERDFPDACWEHDRATLEGISQDFHRGNWGMTNRGQWQIIDYAG